MLVAYHNQPQQKINELKKKIEIYSFFMSQKIGKGYSSTVYKGENDITKQTVAIKVIELKSLKDNITRSLLDTQIICIRNISHPNILKFLDSYTTVNNCYIITQFCEGGDLAQQLRKKRKFTQDELMNFFYEFYGGYKCFSEAGYIHRDLKPANIFLKNGSIRIADFGFVKRSSQNPKQCYNVGTPLYMAPQAMYHNIYSQKTDIWAMGIMLFELANGKTPWKGVNEAQIKKQIDKAYFDFPINCQLSDIAKDFIKKCLIKNPFERISLKDMVNHPWMKSIYAKYEPSNPVPLLNLALNQQKTKRSQSQRSTMQGERKQKQDINILKKINDDQVIVKKPKNPRTILDNLVSVLNYVRYLYKVHACIKPLQLTILNPIQTAIVQQLTLQMHLQQEMIKTKANQFKLLDWQSFVNSPKWSVYIGVIEQYSSKYSSLLQTGKLKYTVKDKLQVSIKIPFSISLKQTIKKLYLEMHSSNKQNEMEQRKLQVLDYLVTLFHFNAMISQQGWQRFIQKSKINKIVQRRCVVSIDNYQNTRKEVEKKMFNFKLI